MKMNVKKIYPIVFLLICCLIPYFVTLNMPKNTSDGSQSETPEFEVKLYRTASKKTESIPLRQYLCGVVAAEMQADSEMEALKAQAVAACSYMIYRYEYQKQTPDAEGAHPDAYVCDDFTHCKGYLSEKEASKRWGRDWYEKNYPRIQAAVNQVYGQVITYDGKPVNAVFHAISSGTTESAENVWGADIPYLQSVESAADTTAAGYESTPTFTLKETKKVLTELSLTPGDRPEEWFEAPQLDSAGSVESIKICGKSFSGTQIRQAFSLRSTAFTVTYREEKFIFTVHGYGHQVGMSQYGACSLAAEGKNYTEILKHYYSGVKIQSYTF